MMTRDTFAPWLRSTWWQIALALVAIGIAFATLKADVRRLEEHKVDRAAFDSVRTEVHQSHVLLCRMSGNARDSSCP